MKKIPLTQGKFALCDDEDYSWLMTWKWWAQKGRNTFYVATTRPGSEGGGTLQMHRLLMLYPTEHTDHWNHNGLDNRKNNLRDCTNRQNQSNLREPGSSKYTGVYWDNSRGVWKSHIKINGRTKTLGRFPLDYEYDAHLTYLAALSQISCPVNLRSGRPFFQGVTMEPTEQEIAEQTARGLPEDQRQELRDFREQGE